MPNGVRCKNCGQQCTTHEIGKDMMDDWQWELVNKCPGYEPNIQPGELKCECTKNQEWCDGLCTFGKGECYNEHD